MDMDTSYIAFAERSLEDVLRPELKLDFNWVVEQVVIYRSMQRAQDEGCEDKSVRLKV